VNGIKGESFVTTLNTVGSSNFVGKSNHLEGSRFYTGKVDDLVIYDRSLSASEISALYKLKNTAQWSTGATTNSITVTPSQTTKYYVTVSDGVTSCRDSVTVTVKAPPVYNPFSDTTSVSNADSIRLNAGSGFTSYRWEHGATGSSINAFESGMYRVKAYDDLGCFVEDSTYLSFAKVSFLLNDSTKVAQIAAGAYHTVVLKKDGTIWTWGRNEEGQLGDGTTVSRYYPVQVGKDNNWRSIAAGSYHTLALKADGTLWSWGSNNGGQLGDGSLVARLFPTKIGLDNTWKLVEAGNVYSVALRSNGTLWEWGNKLNVPRSPTYMVPTQVGIDNNWDTVVAGANHTLALKTDRSLWGWGYNNFGRVGDGTSISRSLPVRVGTENNWKSITAGGNHSLALKMNNTLWGWGFNASGHLGDGSLTDKSIPVQVAPDTDWSSISGGWQHSIAIKANGSLWGWGQNGDGQVGNIPPVADSLYANRLKPVRIGVGSDWAMVNASHAYGFYSLGLKKDGSLWLWGNNQDGQLGIGPSRIMKPEYHGFNVNRPVSDTAICLGQKISLVASSRSYNSYQWSTGASGTMLTVSPGITSRYTVTSFDGRNTNTASISIAVPDTSMSVLDSTLICVSGGAVRLRAGVSSSYKWLRNDSLLAGSTLRDYTATTAGRYRVVVTNASGCNDTSRVVVVTADSLSRSVLPVGPGAVCSPVNRSVLRLVGQRGSIQWQWSADSISFNTLVGQNFDSLLVLNQTSRRFYRAVVKNGVCASDTGRAFLIRNIDLRPSFTVNKAAQCLDSNRYELKNTSTVNEGTLGYQWNFGDSTYSIAASPAMSYRAAGNYKVVLRALSSFGCSDTLFSMVKVNALAAKPVVTVTGKTTSCLGDTIRLSSTSFLAYRWYRNDAELRSDTSRTLNPTSSGVYRIRGVSTKAAQVRCQTA
jgi:alpha-tubulin suppressor-like RCC1 family protein